MMMIALGLALLHCYYRHLDKSVTDPKWFSLSVMEKQSDFGSASDSSTNVCLDIKSKTFATYKYQLRLKIH